MLQSMLDEVEEYWEEDQLTPPNQSTGAEISPTSKKVFVIHGHDEAARSLVVRCLETLRLEAIVLHEQPNKGRTIIEKFEDYTDVGFAVVLLTPDDVGAALDETDQLNPRARQNVILELGFFIGKLSRQNVCMLIKGDIETPSDYDGVVYTEFDGAGGWKTKLVGELKSAGFDVDANRLI